MIARHKKFKRQYRKLPFKLQEKFDQKLMMFFKNPTNSLLNNHKLQGKWKNHRSIDITGNIRAVYKKEDNIIIFVAIGTHSELYE